MRFISEDNSENRSVWMSSEEIINPWELVHQFCKIHSLTSCRFFLWQMLSNSVSAEGQHIDASAGEQIYFFENLMPFIEAVFLITRKGVNDIGIEKSKTTPFTKGRTDSPIQEDKIPTSENLAINPDFTRSCFKKRRRYLRNHSIWFRDKVYDPFKIIEIFFDAYSLANFKTYLIDVLKAVSDKQFYQKGSPSDVLYLLEKWESIINAAYFLCEIDLGLTISSIDNVFTELLRKNEKSVNESSDMLPLLLNKDEILNPQQVINAFFSYKSLKEWKQELIEINSFALSKHPAHEWGCNVDTLSVFVYSVKLAEALYLLDYYRKL